LARQQERALTDYRLTLLMHALGAAFGGKSKKAPALPAILRE